MSVKKKILILLLITITHQNCETGCLRCKNTTCQLCDSTSFYTLTPENTCSKITLPDCQTQINGICLVCQKDSYLDTSQNKCLLLTESEKIDKCEFYNNTLNCKSCESGYYLLNNTCLLSSTIINCEFYLSANKCGSCFDGFSVSLNGDECVENSGVEFCVVFSMGRCLECVDGAFMDDNYILLELGEKVGQSDETVFLNALEVFEMKYLDLQKNCLVSTIVNCEVFKGFDNCEVCKADFFLKDGKCFEFPKERIQNCMIYEKEDECKECEPGYFLESITSCKAVIQITKCEIYDPKESSTVCTKCYNLFYLANNRCDDRQNMSNDCTTFSETEDKCVTCKENYSPTTDGKICLPSTEFCESYTISDENSVALICTKCQPLYHLNIINQCIRGSLSNCLIYTVNQNSCHTCAEKYYESNGICNPHTETPLCLNYHKTLQDTCITCNTESTLMQNSTKCTSVSIENCETYTSAIECNTCKEGYDKVGPLECKKLEPGLNCLSSIMGVCQKCQLNFLLLPSGLCERPYHYEVEYCLKTNMDGLLSDHADVQCTLCLEGTFPIDYKDGYVCVESEEVEKLVENNDLVPFCEGYELKGGFYVCTRCEENKVLKNGACVNNCEANAVVAYKTPLKRFVFESAGADYKLKNVDFCEEEDNSDVCEVKSLKFDGSVFSDYCVDDLKEEGKLITFGGSTFYSLHKKDLNQNTTSENLFQKPFFTYTTFTSIKSTKDSKERKEFLENCDYFYNLPNNEIGCINCRFGQFGRVINWQVDNCHTYDSTKCTKCIQGYYPTNSGLVCTKIVIPGCERFSHTVPKCLKCDDFLYLNTDRLSCVELSFVKNCEFYSTHEDRCVKCDHDYILNSANNNCQKQIEKCVSHDLTFTSSTLITCNKCPDGFYLSSDYLKCDCETLVQNCWRYLQDGTNTCEYYMNSFEFKQINKCLAPTKIPGCSKYDSSTTCSECFKNYYKHSPTTCCKNRHYFDGTNCINPITHSNCLQNKTDQLATTCSKCLNNYYLSNNNCCPHKTYYNTTTSLCEDKAQIEGNTYNCSVWDRMYHRCITCKTAYYKNTLESLCCAEGTFGADCSGAIAIDDCLRTTDDGSKCVRCDGSKVLRAESGACCESGEFWSGTACVAFSNSAAGFENCANWSDGNEAVSYCEDCESDYYMTNGVCCEGNDGTGSFEFYHSGDGVCKAVGSLVDECLEYDGSELCVKCKDGFVVSDKGLKCCSDKSSFDSETCHDNDYLFYNCLALDEFTTTPNKRFCRKCEENYYLHFNYCVLESKNLIDNAAVITNAVVIDLTTNCLQLNNAKDACLKCKSKTYLTSNPLQCCPQNSFWHSSSSTCISYQEKYKNLSTVKINGISECLSTSNTTYYAGPTNLCCPLGKYELSNTCTDITLSNCLQTQNNTACTKCKPSYYIDNSICVPELTNCKSGHTTGPSGTQSCDQCSKGYMLTNTNTCTEYTTHITSNLNSCTDKIFASELCVKLDFGDNCDGCEECGVHGYNQYNKLCCPLGYTYNEDEKRCFKIKNKYCAKYDNSYKKCESCFLNENYCSLNSSHNFDLRREGFGRYDNDFSDIFVDNPDFEFLYLASDSDECCPLGKYWVVDECADIPIANCSKYVNGLCSDCHDEYVLDLEFKQCCRYNEDWDDFFKACLVDSDGVSCPYGQYKSNEHCCKEKSYWDLNLGRCLPLFDKYCIESNSKETCTKCDTDFTLEKYYKFSLNLNYESLESCKNPNEKFVIQFCRADSNSGQYIYDYPDFKKLINNCSNYNETNEICDQCMEGSYLTNGNPHCCLDTYFGYKGKCRILNNLVKNCNNYDHTNRECIKCSQNYHLTKGVCCKVGEFLNNETMECDVKYGFCKIFDVDLGICTECLDNKYFTNGNCCNINYYYNLESEKCEEIKGEGLHCRCEKLDDFGTCTKCHSDFYLHKKHCCKEGTFWDSVDEVCKEGITNFDQRCIKFGFFDECLECDQNSYFNNYKCCKYGTFYDIDGDICTYTFEFNGCKVYKDDKTCESCFDEFYYSNGHCCRENYYYDLDENKCLLINEFVSPNCERSSDFGKNCDVCDSGYYISDGNCCLPGNLWNRNELRCDPMSTNLTSNNCIKTLDGVNCSECSDNTRIALKETGEYIFTCKAATVPLNCSQATAKTEGSCTICLPGNYLNSGSCCPINQYYNSGCKPMPITNCEKTLNGTTCLKCKDNFYLANSAQKCVAHGSFWNSSSASTITTAKCLEASDANTCTKCEVHFELLEGTCTENLDNTELSYYCSFDIPSQRCLACDTGRYLSGDGKACCPNDYFWDGETCNKELDGYLRHLGDDCLRLDNEKCTKCLNNKYVTGGQCCLENFYYNQTKCVSISNGLANCKRYTDEIICEMTSEELNPTTRAASCINNNYFHKAHCCNVGEFWDEIQCAIISRELNIDDCDMVGETNKCIKCIAGKYVTNGYCCDPGTYRTDSTTCSPITRPSCTERSQNLCLNCSTSINTLHPQCCQEQYFSLTTDTCVNKPSDCDEVDHYGNCLTCDSTHYLTNKRCCLQGEYFDGTSCESISTINNCLEIADYDTSDSGVVRQCSLCNNATLFVRSGKCCLEDELFFLDKGCMKSNLIEGVCSRLKDDGSCDQCDKGYLSDGACCEENKYFDLDGDLTCKNIGFSNCVKQTGGVCIECENEYYLNSFITGVKCCAVGFSHNVGKTDCDGAATKIDFCNNFDETTRKCSSCLEGYNLYLNPANNVCCQDGKFWNGTECYLIYENILNCKQFSIEQMDCLDCDSGYHLMHKHCCLTGYNWSLSNLKCEKNDIQNCLLQKDGTCINCETDYYLLNNACCQLQYHWDTSQNKCIKNADKLCYKYDFSISTCIDCYNNTGENQVHLYKGECCFRGLVFENGSCQRIIQNCEVYERNLADTEWLCKKCKGSYELSQNQTSCCEDNTLFVKDADYGQQCVHDPIIYKFLINCFEYDSVNLNCLKCGDGYYMSRNICCPNGTFRDSDTDDIKCIPIVNYPSNNCIEYDSSVSKCTNCLEGFKVNTSGVCVEIFDFCEDFDSDNVKCLECSNGKYLSDLTGGNCCLKGYKWNSSSCVVTGDNCSRVQSSECTECKEGFYLKDDTPDFCCKNSNYCSNSSTSVAGNIKNCKKYNTSADDCIECNNLFSVLTLKDGIKYCLPTPEIAYCDKQTLSTTATENTITCTCSDQYYTSPFTGYSKILEHFFYPTEHCEKFENKHLFSESTLKCLGCSEDRFYNEISGACEERTGTTTYTNCEAPYIWNENKCLKCKEYHWYDSSAKECKLAHSEDTTCLFYNGTECEVCKLDDGTEDYWRVLDLDASWPDCDLESVYDLEDVVADDPSIWQGFIYKCRTNFECSDVYLNGLDNELQKFVSCHKCNDDTKIPFISIKAGDNSDNLIGIQKYKINLANTEKLNSFLDDNVNFTNQCLKKDLSDFNLVSTNNFPSNCAIGILNSDLLQDASESNSSNPSTTKLGIYCGACEPGYKPTYNTNKTFQVETCTLITNCLNHGSAFNQCDECSDDYAFAYTNSTGIDRGSCVDVSDNKYCYTKNTDDDVCVICKKGHSLNIENKCELLNAPYCENEKMANNKYLKARDYELIIYRGIIGCQTCSSGYYGIFRPQTELVCTESLYLKKGEFISVNPEFDSNCINYGINSDDKIYCHTCKDGFAVVERSDVAGNKIGKCMVKTGNLFNCQTSNISGVCQICDDGFVRSNNICISKNISRCITYKDNAVILTCETCEDKYYLKNNSCHEGEIPDCLTYSDETSCSKCEESYEKVITKNALDYCMPITTNENCKTFNPVDFKNKILTCTECKPDYLIETINPSSTVCNRIQLIPSCSKYDINTTFITSSFHCIECHANYYLSTNTCQTRSLSLINCKTYSITSDTCSECEGDYYLNDTNTECILNPTGVIGCSVFENESTCLVCSTNYYLEANICVPVPVDNIIDHCERNSDAIHCEKCENGYVLDVNVCVPPNVLNCEVYESVDSCEKCNGSYGIKEEGGENVCKSLPTVLNCDSVALEYPFACSKCSDGYFLDFNVDSDVICSESTVIQNCKEYEADNLCKKCQSDNILAKDQLSCFSYSYSSNNNCAYYKEEETPFCVLCLPGFKLDDSDNCVAIDYNTNLGCLLFDYNDFSKCEVCKTNYYQDYDGSCVEVISNIGIQQANDTDANIDEQQFVDKFSKYGVFALVILLFLS